MSARSNRDGEGRGWARDDERARAREPRASSRETRTRLVGLEPSQYRRLGVHRRRRAVHRRGTAPRVVEWRAARRRCHRRVARARGRSDIRAGLNEKKHKKRDATRHPNRHLGANWTRYLRILQKDLEDLARTVVFFPKRESRAYPRRIAGRIPKNHFESKKVDQTVRAGIKKSLRPTKREAAARG